MITKFELFESLFEDKSWQDYKKYNLNVKSSDGVLIDDEIGEMIFATDPTPNKMYWKWLVEQFKKLPVSTFKDYLNTANELLRVYHSGFKRIPEEYSDYKQIMKLDFEGLREVVNFILENEYHISKKSVQKKTKAESKVRLQDDSIILYEDDEWVVAVPLTHAQSIYWAHNSDGKGAGWCTSALGDSGHYKSYTSSGPLYIFHYITDRQKSSNRLSHQLFINMCSGSGKYTEFKGWGNSSDSVSRFFSQYPKLLGALIDFWSNPEYEKYLKNSLDNFLNTYITNPTQYKDYEPIASAISASGADVKITEKNLEKMMYHNLTSLNFVNIKKYFDKNPEKINNNFSEKDSGNMTPLFACVRSKTDAIPNEKRDELTMRICKYLISKGADGSGTDENGGSNIAIEALRSKKFGTLSTIIDLPGYDINNLEKNASIPVAFLLSTVTDAIPNEITYEQFDYILGKLIDKGVNINEASNKHKTIGKNLTVLSSVFLKLSSYMNAKGKEDEVEKCIEIIKIFLNHGADPCESTDGSGNSLVNTNIFDNMEGTEIHSLWNKATKKCK